MHEYVMLCKASAGTARDDGMRWINAEKLRGTIVQSTHMAHGHVKALRTQMIKRDFYWPGMYTAGFRFANTCLHCMSNRDIKIVMPITDHPRTDAPGKVWVVDLLHAPTHGRVTRACVSLHRYILQVARDVAAKDTKSLTVATALVQTIITGAAGYIKVLG